jgi:hypothetical protein
LFDQLAGAKDMLLLLLKELSIFVQVQVANVGFFNVLRCSSCLVCDDYGFATDMGILPLLHFDIMLGMYWLEEFSPMKVHWKHKWMEIPYKGSTAFFLQGIVPGLPNEVVVCICILVDAPSSPPIVPLKCLLF